MTAQIPTPDPPAREHAPDEGRTGDDAGLLLVEPPDAAAESRSADVAASATTTPIADADARPDAAVVDPDAAASDPTARVAARTVDAADSDTVAPSLSGADRLRPLVRPRVDAGPALAVAALAAAVGALAVVGEAGALAALLGIVGGAAALVALFALPFVAVGLAVRALDGE